MNIKEGDTALQNIRNQLPTNTALDFRRLESLIMPLQNLKIRRISLSFVSPQSVILRFYCSDSVQTYANPIPCVLHLAWVDAK